MEKFLFIGVYLILVIVPYSAARDKDPCSGFGYELLATRLDALESITLNSQLKSNENAQNVRKDIQELTWNIESLGWNNSNDLPRSCSEVRPKKSGIQRLDISRGLKAPIKVFCDQDFEDGGWLVIQNRFNGAVDFYRPWAEYKEGFGALDGEFWLGLDKIHEITYSGRYELAIQMEGFDGDKAVARYTEFAIGSEAEFYSLIKLGTYNGTANDGLSYHSGQQFTTFDRDNDEHKSNCANSYIGAWWYKACHMSNLNSRHDQNGQPNRIAVWRKWKGDSYALKKTRMMIKLKP
ncbi:microfibril-associated glycoprotein 4 isoform X2 [Aedes aegypti]|uniref:Uncharacterized protein n=1 Tax=Aedes aegypti TaxID=7159 RepID=A0A1S4F410_AEDAE|nr:microfibril-associated glycoprotein 4 isoform X2 [Aedes aegypti]